ncbi:Negative elongation factor B [Clonorchis sinensis]|uniref:Negative elongation factor B n=2 Tax=Clonorchis sinensis TaxID=79923 RepID=A0A8T1M3K6_CLOSI|nr:Negative elongation factor B [Clonorchis sinensis]
MTSKPTAPKPFVFPVMKKAIEDLFTKPTITKEDVEAFQDRYWEQLVPNFSQALKLLDIHGVPRHNILWSINDRLLDAIKAGVEAKCEDPDQRKCQKLWQKLIKTGMVYIHHPYMRALIMQVLGKMNAIKERHVNMIVDNQYLYDDAPLPVLRHIWVAHPHKFQEELDKVIAKFQNSWSDALLDALSMGITSTASSTADLLPLLYWPPKRRRRDTAIIRMVEMIGDGQTLYDKTVTFLRDQCVRLEQAASNLALGSINREASAEPITPPTKRRRRLDSNESSAEKVRQTETPTSGVVPFTPPAFLPNQPAVVSTVLSTIRFDLLMSLNEAKIDRLCVPDRIHQFVWCLDACVRNRRIDQRHASGLAYHLTVQRQRAKKMDAVASEQSGDTDEESGSHHEPSSKVGSARSRSTKHSVGASSKTGHKKSSSEGSANTEETDGSEAVTESQLLERDIHMACRDPWVLYNICTSLIRYALNGLYENKLPREIPEVSLLVHFLILGVGDDFTQHLSPRRQPWQGKDRLGSKKGSQNTDEGCAIPKSPSKALVGHVLPAVAQLQVLTWRAQVAEQIIASSSNVWPGAGISSSLLSPGGSAQPARRCSSSGATEARESTQPPAALQKQITDATNSTTVAVPSDYFAHPIGYLILQYHALFALERNEVSVLRALLKAAANVVQQQLRATRANKACAGKIGPSSPPSPLDPGTPQIQFRWRPEVLQALVLGIARLPHSVPAFVDVSRSIHGSTNTGSVGMVDNTNQMETGNSGSDAADSELLGPGPISVGTGDSGATSSTAGQVRSASGSGHGGLLSDSRMVSSSTMITRAELATLLRASLTLVGDLQLLALAQLALLVPGPNASGSACSNTNASLLSSTDTGPLEPLSPVMTERERLTNTLARHCTSVAVSDTPVPTEAPPSVATTSGPYKSADPRVLQALDFLRKDIDRSLAPPSLPLTPTGLPGPKSIPFPYNQPTPFSGSGSGGSSTRFSGFQVPAQPDSVTWAGATPRSPSSDRKGSRFPQSSFSTTSRFEFKSYGVPSSSFYSSSPSVGPQLPIGTPLTNPGLMGATPHLNNLALGHGMMPPTPRRPSTPPREFRPSSPLLTNSSVGQSGSSLGAFGVSAQQFGAEFSSSCPSPSIHRSANNGSTTSGSVSGIGYSRPRSPSPPDV